ncbi:MAG TPA: tyrosine-type recombinase/integrase [Gallionellaceae bacterium]|jgi:site-specific recombinase XerC|nr:tyrosine-type recombinase/integrase [Gallionellaceae bacterium]HQS76668.1 tyrosine-type recombinase/integrase [Gallionellaceae bacterium]
MLKKYLPEDEQRRLRNTLKQTAGPVARRDGGTIELLTHTGMRIGECLHLSVGDAVAALKTGYIFLAKETRKGRADEKRDHEVLVTVPVRAALNELLALREGAALDEALIVSRKSGGQAMSVRAFEQRVAYWAKQAGLPDGVSPHWFRHTRAMNIMRRTTSPDPLGIVKAALGHSSIRSTEVYARQTRENVEAALREVDGKPRLRLADLRKMHEGRVSL